MKPLTMVTSAALAKDSSAKFWALLDFVLQNKQHQALDPQLRQLYLAYIYDAEVMNGGHLQYFFNQGSAQAVETIEALKTVGAMKQAEILKQCLAHIPTIPYANVSSLETYSELAKKHSFELDSAYYAIQPEVIDLLESHYKDETERWVGVCA